ncbi:hypothetical protein [Actinocorallia libanotica]|uniref:Uncharacterized protein n=1 Tax=Actinocorallia libanotica TaxID=46162 RepID=A0ABP4BAW7_9ACTN
MIERTIYLDPDRHDSRKIHVQAYRWYARVELNRDDYVDALAGTYTKMQFRAHGVSNPNNQKKVFF